MNLISYATLALFTVFCLLQVADAYITYVILSKGGKELNPLMRAVMDRIGVLPGLVICKSAMCVLVWFYAMYAILLAIFNIVYAVVVINNVKQLSK